MTQVAPELDQVVAEGADKVLALFGVPPPKRASGVGAPKNKTTAPVDPKYTYYTYLANLIRPIIGYQLLDESVGLTQHEFNADMAFVTYFIGVDMANLVSVMETGLQAAQAQYQAEIKFVSGLISGTSTQGNAATLAQARAWFNQAEADIKTVWTNAYNTALAAQHNAEKFAQAAVNAEAATRASQITGEAFTRQAQIDHAESDISAVLAAAVTSAKDAQHSAEAYALGLHQVAETDISTVWTDAYNTAMAVKNNAYAYTDAAVTGLGSKLETQLATQVEPELARVGQEVDTCLAPMCDTVAPNAKQLGKLGNLLKGLESLGIAALVSGLVAAAVADPEAAAHSIETVAGWTTGAADDLVSAVGG